MKATAELKMLPVSVLKPAAYNPRKKLKPGDKEDTRKSRTPLRSSASQILWWSMPT